MTVVDTKSQKKKKSMERSDSGLRECDLSYVLGCILRAPLWEDRIESTV